MSSDGGFVLAGGTVVTTTSVRPADVLVRGGRIAAIGLGLAGELTADVSVVDVSGHLLLPGGVDTHTHLEYGIDGFTTRTADDFETGTVAAALGGTTTVVDFVKKEPEHTLRESFHRRREAVEKRAAVDVGLHAIVPPAEQQPDAIDDAIALVGEGVTSWKFFMAYPGTQMVDDGRLLAGMRAAADHGALPMVHAENGHIVARRTDELVTGGMTGERYHHAAHTHESEAEAVHRAIVLAGDVDSPLFVVHVSSALAAEEIGRARTAGAPVWAETCPQYLATAYEDYADLGERAAAYLCSPPIRERANQEALWTALRWGGLSTVGTDHAGFCLHQPDDLPPQKMRSRGFFPKVPNGVPGVHERLMVLYELGVVAGRLDLSRFVDVVATRPAKLFGLYPRKGAIEVGADADIVVWDCHADHTVRATETGSRAGYSLYEGMRVTGRPAAVYARGELIADGGQFVGAPGQGGYLARSAPDLT